MPVLADAFVYPAPGRLAALETGAEALPKGCDRETRLLAFLAAVEPLSLGAWEELYTRTLDLDPPAPPYIGYQMWGDSYQRGAFMAKMKQALREVGLDAGGELPDHLAPCLRYLSVAAEPLPELVEVIGPAVDRMQAALRKAQPGSPYLSLLKAVQSALQGLVRQDGKKEAA